MRVPEQYRANAARAGVEAVDPAELAGKRLFHGTSTPGLESIEPAAKHRGPQNHPNVANPNKAYVTSSERSAWVYAAQTGRRTNEDLIGPTKYSPENRWDYFNAPASETGPRVYEVEPEGEILTDPEAPKHQFQADRARVVREDASIPPGAQATFFRAPHSGGFFDFASDVTSTHDRSYVSEMHEKRVARGVQDDLAQNHPQFPGTTRAELNPPKERPSSGIISRLLFGFDNDKD